MPIEKGFDSSQLESNLDAHKIGFLNDVESSVYSYVVGRGKECIAIVEKIPRPNGTFYTVTHRMGLDDADDFVRALVAFMSRKQFRGHDLDSALTEPILKIVEEKYVILFSGQQTEITTASSVPFSLTEYYYVVSSSRSATRLATKPPATCARRQRIC